jgi:bla regulator protein blaR1
VVSRSRPLACHLRESADVLTPVAVGVLRPAVLLPVGWRGWSPATRRAVLAHEFAHLRRRDSLVSALAQAIRCMFWFHPLTWWIVRKISELAEMACDTAALARVADPAQYSRILLEFAATAHRAGYRTALPGLAMAASSQMGRRIDRVFEFSGGVPRKLPRPGMVLAAIGVPVLCLAATVALGEQGESGPVAFEVASVKAAAPMAPDEDPLFCVARCNPGERLTVIGSRVDLRSMSLAHLIMTAYRIKSYQLSGPPWMESEKFDIAAKIPEGVGKDRLPQMLEALLAGRFKLSIHRESREQPVYALVVGKDGSKLQPSTAAPFALDPEGSPMHTPQGEGRRLPDGTFVANDGEYGPIHGGMQPGGGFKLEFLKLTVPKLAEVLTAHADRPVVDMTELKGFYRLTAQNRSLAEGAGRKGAAGDPVSIARPDAFGDALFSAVERAGLKIEKTKAPVETIVVDRVEKTAVVN